MAADGLGEYDILSMKVTSSGAVTATYKFFKGTFDKKTKKPQYVSYTCSSVLIPVSAASEKELTGFVPVFFPAAGGFGGYAGAVAYPFRDRGAE